MKISNCRYIFYDTAMRNLNVKVSKKFQFSRYDFLRRNVTNHFTLRVSVTVCLGGPHANPSDMFVTAHVAACIQVLQIDGISNHYWE